MGNVVLLQCECGYTDFISIGSGQYDSMLSLELRIANIKIPEKFKYLWYNKKDKKLYYFYSDESYDLDDFISEESIYSAMTKKSRINCPVCSNKTLSVNAAGFWD